MPRLQFSLTSRRNDFADGFRLFDRINSSPDLKCRAFGNASPVGAGRPRRIFSLFPGARKRARRLALITSRYSGALFFFISRRIPRGAQMKQHYPNIIFILEITPGVLFGNNITARCRLSRFARCRSAQKTDDTKRTNV